MGGAARGFERALDRGEHVAAVGEADHDVLRHAGRAVVQHRVDDLAGAARDDRAVGHDLAGDGEVAQLLALVVGNQQVGLGNVEGRLQGLLLREDVEAQLVVREQRLLQRNPRLEHLLHDLLQLAGRATLAGPGLGLGEPQPEVGRLDRGVGDRQLLVGRDIAKRATGAERLVGAELPVGAGAWCTRFDGRGAEESDAVGHGRVLGLDAVEPCDAEIGFAHILRPVDTERLPAGAGEVELAARERRHVHVHVVVDVGTVVAGGISAARTDVVGIGIAVDLDHLVGEVGFLFNRVLVELVRIVLGAAQLVAQLVGVVPDVDRVLQGHQGAFVDLLELGLVEGRVEPGRVDVEGHHVLREAERIQSGVGLVDLALHVLVLRGDLVEMADGGTLDLLDTDVAGIGILRRHHRVDGHPIKIGTHAGAATPLREAPGALGLGVVIALPLPGGIGHEGLAIGQVHDLGTGAGLRCRGFRKLAFVEEIHLQRHARHLHRLGPWIPREEGMAQQAVIDLGAGEVMAPGIAVALREHDARIELVDHAVEVLVAHVVAEGVGHLAIAGGEVPEQAVVDRRRGHRAVRHVAPAQQHEFFRQQRVELVLEVEDRGREREVAGRGGDGNGRILRIGIGLVAEQGVEIDQARSHQQDRRVGRAVVDRRRGVGR